MGEGHNSIIRSRCHIGLQRRETPLYYRRASLKPEDRMKPGHEERRKIIREWMAFPKDKRQTKEQLEAFAKNAMGRIPFSRDPYRQILTWLLPRTGKP